VVGRAHICTPRNVKWCACCHVFQYVAKWCSQFQCVAACCSVSGRYAEDCEVSTENSDGSF